MSTAFRTCAVLLACSASAAFATDLDITLDCDASVTPGAAASFTMTGTLSSDSDNEGLALFGVTMSAAGPEDIALGDAAVVNPGASMGNFVNPDGLNNPTDCEGCFGYGGTAIGNDLVQIGGGMNTIGNTVDNAPFPIGSVDLGIAFPPGGSVLAEGTITMPNTEGVYNINLGDGFANVISQGETGPDVFATESATVNATGCVIEVVGGNDAVIIAAQSIRDHGGTDVAIDLVASNGIEPRQDGLLTGAFTADQDLDGGTVNAGNVQVNCAVGANPAVASAVLEGDNRTITVDLAGSADDQNCCTFAFAGVQTIGGDGVGSFDVTLLAGDVNFSGGVTGSDPSLIKPHFGEIAGVDLAGGEFDFNVSGGVTGGDFSLIKPLLGNVAAACP